MSFLSGFGPKLLAFFKISLSSLQHPNGNAAILVTSVYILYTFSNFTIDESEEFEEYFSVDSDEILRFP